MSNIATILMWTALLQGFLLAMLYIFSKKHKSFSNFLLGCFLISIILEALTSLLPMRFVGGYPIDTYFSLPEVKLFIPLFFLHYVLTKLGKTARYISFLKFNYILAISIAAITLFNLYLFAFQNSSVIGFFGLAKVEIFHLSQQIYAFAVMFFAFIVAIKETLAYRKLARNEYSDYKMLQINWLWQFIFMILPATVLWGFEIIRILYVGADETNFQSIIWGFVALFLFFLSYKAYQHQNLFDAVPESTLKPSPENTLEPNTHLCNEAQSQTIQQFMHESELFLEQDLTLHHFASAINLSPRLISSCINKNFGNNFNEWVNSYRVEKALKMIQEDVKNQLSIEGIGTTAGFKSRSTMYSAFQKKLGHSPGYFRNNNVLNPAT